METESINQQKYEFVQYPKMKHIRVIVNQITNKHTHMHPDLELATLLSGNGQIHVEDKLYVMKPGDIVFINSNTPHSYSTHYSKEIGPDFKNSPVFLIIQFSNYFECDYFPDLERTIFQSSLFSNETNPCVHTQALQYLINFAINYFEGEENYKLLLLAKLDFLLYFVYRFTPHQIISKEESERLKLRKNRLERIIELIKKNFESQIQLSDIAEQENLTKTYVSHLFKSSLGFTFQDYVNNLRLEQAIRLMADEKKSLLEISFESGFSDPKYMFKMFEKNMHCTPKEYRKKLSISMTNTEQSHSPMEHIFSEYKSLQFLKSCPFYGKDPILDM